MQLSWEPIGLEQQDAYRAKLAQCAQISADYSFINLWGWQKEYGLQWAWSDELVWIKQNLPETRLWAPVGNWTAIDWPAVLDALKSTTQHIIRVPEALLPFIQKSIGDNLQSMEMRAHWEYLYSIEELSELKGNRFHKKKNLVNQFKKKYSFEYLPFGPEMIEQATTMQEDWCIWRDCESHDTLAAENKVIDRVLSDWQSLKGITGGALEVGGILVAYTIAETLPDNALVVHFEKADHEYKGSYQAINQIFLSHTPDGYKVVNREQDLGDEGLRKAKLSYHPIDYIRKYQVTL